MKPDVYFSCTINGETFSFSDKLSMFAFIENYSKSRLIYSCGMFKFKVYNIKNKNYGFTIKK